MTPARLSELAGGVLGVGIDGTWLDAATRRRLAALAPAGVILFARNVEHEAQVRALCDDLSGELLDPLLLIDQEGGRVDRLRAYRGRTRPPRELAALGADAVEAEARIVARDLAALGVNFNCVPVVDLDEGREANGIGDRSLGGDPAVVADLARRIIEAHAASGVATCLKHFPGLGRTGLDTHVARPAIDASAGEMDDRELAPFRALRDVAPAIMVCHAAAPALTESDAPASLSRDVVTGLLRERLGYDGLVVSDDLAMGAVADRSPAEQAVEAIEAGCDLLLYCQPSLDAAEAAREAIVERASADAKFAKRLGEAWSRVVSLRGELARARRARLATT